MKPPDRQQYRLAQYILHQIQSRDSADPERVCSRIPDIRETFTRLSATARRLELCTNKNWRAAAQIQREEIGLLARELITRASELQGIAQTSPSPEPPTLRDVLGDLLQLEEEFERVDVDHKGHQVTVHTEPITLEDVYQGPFKVELNLAALSRPGGDSYKIIAVDPHPASSNDSVTHPHVKDEELCEGDAGAGIRSALKAGRLCDFFMLVRSVLTTYNSGSPYVALADWEGGISCHDCGYVASENDSRYCDSCNNDFCDDCMSYCRQCDDSRCRGCLENCSACDEPTCSGCGNKCSDCGDFVCQGCLENQLCPACREKEEDDDGTDENTADTGTIIMPAALSIGGSRRQRRRHRHRNIAA